MKTDQVLKGLEKISISFLKKHFRESWDKADFRFDPLRSLEFGLEKINWDFDVISDDQMAKDLQIFGQSVQMKESIYEELKATLGSPKVNIELKNCARFFVTLGTSYPVLLSTFRRRKKTILFEDYTTGIEENIKGLGYSARIIGSALLFPYPAVKWAREFAVHPEVISEKWGIPLDKAQLRLEKKYCDMWNK